MTTDPRDSMIAALREALRGLMAYMGADDEDATEQERTRAAAMRVLADTEAAAKSLLERVRREERELARTATLKEVARQLASREAMGYATDIVRELMSRFPATREPAP